MSLEQLRQNCLTESASGRILIHAATFSSAGLTAPVDLDLLLSRAFVDVNVSTGLPIATTKEQIGPIQTESGVSFFLVTGTINVAIAQNKPAEVRFSAIGSQGALVIGINLGAGWVFGDSFLSLGGATWRQLAPLAPWFYFAGQTVPAYPWNGQTVLLSAGLNFAGSIKLAGYLETAVDLLPGLQPLPDYVLSGTIDPASGKVDVGGVVKYGYPGLVLRTTPLANSGFNIGYLTVDAPYISLTGVDYGEGVGVAPAVMVAAALRLPGVVKPPQFRVQLSANSDKSVTFSYNIVNPDHDQLAFTADQLFFLMAGSTFYSMVPAQLINLLQQFGFKSFGIFLNLKPSLQLASVQAVIASGSPWVVMADPELSFKFELDWTISSPFSSSMSQYASLRATARFLPDLFPGEFHFEITTDLVVSGGYSAKSPAEYVSFNKLVAAVTGGLIQIPPQFISIEFQEFFVVVNQPARSYSFGATTSIKLPVLGEGNLELNDVAIRLGVQRPQAPSSGLVTMNGAGAVAADGTRYTGSITGSLIVGPLFLLVDAQYNAGAWLFQLRMQPGTKVDLQSFIDRVFQAIALPPDIFEVGIQISDVALTIDAPAAAGATTKYSGGGSLRWVFTILDQKIDTLARIQLAYDSAAKPNKYTGKVSATTTFDIFGVGATFTVEYEIANQPGTNQGVKTIRLIWEGLSLAYVQGSGQQELVFQADSTWNLGRLIQTLVRFIAPSSAKELPTPWNLLNNISLGGMKVKFNLTTKAVTASWPIGLKLFFGEITSFDIVKTPGQQVNVTLTGKFVFNNADQVKWDALTQDPPVVPGGGDSAFDLRLLALGQHVTVPDLDKIRTVGDAVNQLTGFKAPPPTSRVVPVLPAGKPPLLLTAAGAEPAAPRFSRDSNWLIGTHFFAVSGTLDLKVIFNDPVLYGLRIGLAGEKAKIFKGLEFEILYKKITESIGMYRVMLKLPDAMRYLQFGTVTIILPVVTVEIYTNGNFKVDFGFPRNLDFSVSFTLQVFPFTGSGGFYFGWLNGATSTQTPANPSCGTFNPVIEFGLGLQVGLGKSLNFAIVRAEISVTIFGIIEGVIGTWRPYSNGAQSTRALTAPPVRRMLNAPDGRELTALTATTSSDVSNEYYYKVTGTLGLVGKIVGVVDFAIIKAEVSLTVYAYIQGIFEAYRKTLITMEAGIQVSVKLTINFGFFKISINLSFSARIREQFVIGADRLEDAPWYCGGKTTFALPIASRIALRPSPLAHARALNAGPNFAPLATPAYGKLPLDTFIIPQLSIDGEAKSKADQAAVYSINLFVSNEQRTQGTETYESFRRLLRDEYLWIASSFSGEAQKGTPEQELDRVATYAQLQSAKEYLSANSDGRAVTYANISAFLGNLFELRIELPPATTGAGSTGPNATPFPMPPELTMKATYKTVVVAERDFINWVTAGEAYLTALQTSINKLMANLLDELERQHDERPQARALLRRSLDDTRSIANFVFGDYFAMLAQGLVQDAIDTFDNFGYRLQPNDSIASIRQAFNSLGGGSQNQLTDEQIAWQNRSHTLAQKVPLTINAVPYRLQDGDTLEKIATSHGLKPGTIAQTNATVDMTLIPGRPITIGTDTHDVPDRGSIALTAALFGLTPETFGENIANTPGLLNPLTVIALNGLQYTTKTSDTIVAIAESYGIEIPVLTPSIAGAAGLFDGAADPFLSLPGLSALTNRDIWENIEATSGAEHLSGMAGRYLLNGLRLPTAGLTFFDPAHPCKTGSTCGFENLTGQQFPLPALDGYDPANPLTISLANPANVPWVQFTEQTLPAFDFKVPAEAATQVNELVAYARKTGLQAPIQPPAAADLAIPRARQYTFKNNIILQTASPIPLPIKSGTAEPRPRIWNFSAGLQTELARPVDLAPLFRIEIGSTNTDGGRVLPRPAASFGWATLINVAIKRVVGTLPGGAPVSPTTYELVGADEVGVNQLERLLQVISPQNSSIIDGVYILYPPNQSSDRAQGQQYDGQDRYTTFLVQANLSTETNPPTAKSLAITLGAPARGLLNTPYRFLSMLWQGSIVRSGGYYFKYVLPDGNGFPSALFNEDSIANISVLVIYKPIDALNGSKGGVLRDFMNAAVIDDPIDDSNDVVYTVSAARSAQAPITTTTTLAGVSAAYHAGVIEIASANDKHLVSKTVDIDVTDIVHQVKRGETLAQIAAYFHTTEQKIRDLNPNVDFANLIAGIALHMPDLVTHAASPQPGLTLMEIARYYDSTLAAVAWANRDKAGLYDVAGGALKFDDLLIDKEGAMTAGNVGIVVTRTNPGQGEQTPAYLEQQYNLLGYDLISNTDCLAIPNALPLPVGPANDEDEQSLASSRRAAPLAASDTDPWVYRFNVPASRAARNNPVPESTTGNPFPARDMNPYAGAGGIVQLSLDWRDMMGNRTWSPFDDNSPGNTYPLNNPPARLGTTDDVIGLGQWPSTLNDHFFARRSDNTGGELRIEWHFDPSRYVKQQEGDDTWLRNAEADRQVFANLYYQLVQTARDGSLSTRIFTLCSLAPSNPLEVSSADRAAIGAYALAAWRYVVKVIALGTLPPPADLPLPISIVRPIDAPATDVITEIAVVLRFERVTSIILPDFRDESASRVADCVIGPRLTQPTPTAGYTLEWYTASFQAAFEQTDASLRLASGTPRSDLGMQGGRDTLWAVRLGKPISQPYAVRIKDPAIFFALAPLSTELQNRPDVSLYSFTPEHGLSKAPDQKLTFTGIDLDVWASNALGAIDELLKPQYGVPAFLVDQRGGTTYLDQILDAKKKLAEAVVTGLTNVLTSPALDPATNTDNFTAAREKLRQQLLIKLANAYAIDAVVQYELQVAAPAVPQGAIAPRLYGSPTDPTQSEQAKDYTVSAYKIPLRPDKPLLTFTFAARDTRRQSSFHVPFTYVPTHIEHDIVPAPGGDGYEASSWLNFVDTPAPLTLESGASTIPVDIPIPLRAYPTAPSLLNQAFTGAASSIDPTTTLQKAKEWTFRFFYSQVHAAQDRIDAVVRFNVPQTSSANARLAETVDLFVMLARLNHVLTQVQAVFTADLLTIDVNTPADSTAFLHSQNALSALAFLLTNLNVQWKVWTKTQPTANALLSALDENLPFSILEDPYTVTFEHNQQQQTEEALRVTIAYPEALLPGMTVPPIITFEGYTAEPVSPEQIQTRVAGRGNAHEDVRTGLRAAVRLRHNAAASALAEPKRIAWIYRKNDPQPGDLPYLGWDEAQGTPQRTVEIPSLDSIRFQNAWARIQIIRNAELVGPRNPTRRPFIYTTPEVQFRNKLTPLLDVTPLIDVAAVPSGLPVKRTLPGHLTALFQAFFAGSPATTQLVKLEVRYSYRLAIDTVVPPIEMPVLLYPPAEFEIPKEWTSLTAAAGAPPVPAAQYIATVSGEIEDWFALISPSRQNGTITFDLSAFSSLSNNSQPLVRVRNLVLTVDMVEGLSPM